MVRLMDNGEAPDPGAEAPLSDLPLRLTRMLLKHPVSARVPRPLPRGDEAVAPTGQAVACAGMILRISKQLLVAGRKAPDPGRPWQATE
jgi:hypothetical protein